MKPSLIPFRYPIYLSALLALQASTGSLRAQENPQVEQLRKQLLDLQESFRRMQEEQQRQIDALQKQIDAVSRPAKPTNTPAVAPAAPAPAPTASASAPPPAGSGVPELPPEVTKLPSSPPATAPQPGTEVPGQAQGGAAAPNISPPWSPASPIRIGGEKNYINLSFDALVAAGSSTASDIQQLEPGGHDPTQRGFTVQNLETVFEGAVDPYFRGQANLVFQIDSAGETTFEAEEAYLETMSLPANLQVKAGQFFTELDD